MNIIATRRICQVFFIVLFLWFCLATTLGERWWQLRGWPVNWIIQLDPLVGLGTLLTTRTLYAGLLWGLATVVLTIILGRFFCGWLCPFGSLHQFVGYLAKRKRSIKNKLALNRYHSAQSLKYWILVFLLTMAIAELAIDLIRFPRAAPIGFAVVITLGLAAVIVLAIRQAALNVKKTIIMEMTTYGSISSNCSFVEYCVTIDTQWIFKIKDKSDAKIIPEIIPKMPQYHIIAMLVNKRIFLIISTLSDKSGLPAA